MVTIHLQRFLEGDNGVELDYKAIGRRIKIARIRTGLTQEELADRVGISPTHISNVETGSTRVSLTSLVHLANELGVTMDDLLCENLEKARAQLEKDLSDILEDCDEREIRIIRDMAGALKDSLRAADRMRQTE